MQLNSNSYIVMFAAAVCVGCSFFVSVSAVVLKSRQQNNVRLDKQIKVLQVAGLVEESESLGPDEIQERFDARIQAVLIDMETKERADDVDIDPATYDQQKAAAKNGIPVPKNPAGVTNLPPYAIVYEVYETPEKENVDLRVFPVEGLGLWGTLYGFFALDSDGQTVEGITFYQHKETPGLGGEVDNPLWKSKWPDRKVYNEQGKPAIQVVKGSVGPPDVAPYRVDGLSGATITSNGVTNLLRFWLGDTAFGPYIKRVAEEGSEA